MKRVIIIGAGFAGLWCARQLSRLKKDLKVTLIDKSAYSNFLPMLPDCAGRGINPGYLTYPIKNFCDKRAIEFINREVTTVNLEQNSVSAQQDNLTYDFLVIACGSETNFYNNLQIQSNSFKLDNAQDCRRILKAIEAGCFDNFVISGGGYTGVEIAANISVFLKKNRRKGRTIIVERGASILGPLPQWMKEYVLDNFSRLDIEVLTSSTIEKIEADKVQISGQNELSRAMLIWAAGVKIPDFTKNITAEKNPQGRIKVDEYLRAKDNCFVLGDSAQVASKEGFLRMAVQFAIYQGISAAENIKRLIYEKPLKKYNPVDLGYIIPMANNRSCGLIMGMNLRGRLPTLMHFIMCIYRSFGLKNRLGIIRDLIFKQK